MKTSELIEILKAQQFTNEQAYNLIVGDLSEECGSADIAAGHALIRYFHYKITAVLLPAIAALKAAR